MPHRESAGADGTAPKPGVAWRAPGALGVAACSLSLVEVALTGRSVPLFGVACAASLGLVVGVTLGAVAVCLLALLRVAPALSRVALALYSVAVGVLLADYMGIAAAMAGHARTLAIIAFLVTIAGSLAIGGLLVTLASTPAHPQGWLVTRARLASGPLLAVGLSVLAFEGRFVPSYYRGVQNVGACAAVVLVGIALLSALGRRSFPSWFLGSALVSGAVLIASTVTGLARPSDAVLVGLDDAPIPRVALAWLRRATDVDGDGYSALFGGGDCDPWNARVHPGAREIPGNGVDDNCRFGDAPNPEREPALAPARATHEAPLSVVLLTIDTLRRDRVGPMASGPSLTPNLDAWAGSARSFDRAYTASTRTCSSVASLLYGATPFELAWADPANSPPLRRLQQRLPGAMLHVPWMCVRDETDVSAPKRPSLPSLLRARGMATAAVIDDSFTFLLQRELFGDGFERYEDEGHLTDEPVISRAISLLGDLAGGERRFFLWVHVFGPHDRGALEQDPDVVRGYDSAVRRTDHLLAPLFEAIDVASRKTPLAVLALSDHGELFGPHRRWHGTDLSEDLLRVPLLVRAPGLQPGRSSALVSTVDVLATCLALTDTPSSPGLLGMNLAADEAALARKRILFSDVWNQNVGYSVTAAYDGRTKLVYDHFLGTYEASTQEPRDGTLVPGAVPPASSAPELRSSLDRYLHEHELHFTN